MVHIKYCNHVDCMHMIQGTLPIAEELEKPAVRKTITEHSYRMEGIDYLTFGFDQTCNLSCPSCRTHRIVEKASASTEKARAVAKRSLSICCRQCAILHINPAGELSEASPLASCLN